MIRALWHVPAFFVSGTPQPNGSLPGFLRGCSALSLILTPMRNAAQGRLPVAALFHHQNNRPAWPRASAIFAGLAALPVVVWRRRFFDRASGATEALWPTPRPQTPNRP